MVKSFQYTDTLIFFKIIKTVLQFIKFYIFAKQKYLKDQILLNDKR